MGSFLDLPGSFWPSSGFRGIASLLDLVLDRLPGLVFWSSPSGFRGIVLGRPLGHEECAQRQPAFSQEDVERGAADTFRVSAPVYPDFSRFSET